MRKKLSKKGSRRTKTASAPAVINSRRVDPPPTAFITGLRLVVDVKNWFEIDVDKLTQDVWEIVAESDLSEDLPVELSAPDYEALRDFVRAQSEQEKRQNIASQQRNALKEAESAVTATEQWCAKLLFKVSRHYGVRNAVNSCKYFLRHRLAYIISGLASYQVDDGNVLLPDFADWFGRSHPLPTIPQLVYDQSRLIEVIINAQGADCGGSEYIKVYLPLNRVANTQSGHLLSNVWEPAAHVPRDVWINYVVPQCAAQSALGIISCCPWVSDAATYATEGEVWVGGRSVTRKEEEIEGARSFVVASRVAPGPSPADKAREYLHLIMDPPAQHRGPYHFYPPSMDLPRIAAAGEEILDAIECVDERTWRAPTTWHAAVWLLNVAAGAGEGKPVYPAFKPDEPLHFDSALLFRGQRNTSWGVAPRLLRESDPSTHVKALAIFLMTMAALIPFEEMPTVTAEAHIATAQHYGLATNLLDITVDPLTATFFACDGAIDPEAVVYWMPFDEAVSLGIRMALPPPWIKRLYKQKGLFIDFFHADLKDIKDRCYRILFPPDKSYVESEFGNVDSRLYPDDPWLTSACEWAKTVDIETAELSRDGAIALAEKLRRKLGKPHFMYNVLFPARMGDWWELFEELLDWLAVRMIEGAPEFQCYPLLVMKRDNPGLFANLLRALQIMQSQGLEIAVSDSGIGYYIDAIKKCMESASAQESGRLG
jgi:hypothetical protein